MASAVQSYGAQRFNRVRAEGDDDSDEEGIKGKIRARMLAKGGPRSGIARLCFPTVAVSIAGWCLLRLS